ncbi:Hsp33 family molecular chaperone HslO [Chengkuizengella sp. 2205SS18-9]|uniref:33 kDa chaperonin n=2 Tax=Chengkuizengella axinellae TaxID=3064388 RepID=A0ABT9J5S3_9BACL|nr:Hsp33 family molecular chaperone HslO [Chengkuizengella sp. 2205SS18-9]MDP5276968.1 Hsp33 family molecular chaperone HslO [Chengkuizengella sp. 2205SS18-9]
MNDYLIRGTAMDGKVRAFAVNTTELVEEIRQRQESWPTATAALGRAATVGVIMGAMLKNEEKLTIQIKGNGPMGQIVVDANAHGEVRAYADHPQVQMPSNAQNKLDVAGAVGREGSIFVTKDLGMKEPYRGSIPIISGELGEDFTYYFAKSEQTPSAVSVGVLVEKEMSVKVAGGFVIQLLPGLSDDEITEIEQKLGQIKPMTELLEENKSLEQILQEILPSVQILDQMDVKFKCHCSREKVEGTLVSLGEEELNKIIEEDQQAEVVCHFCNEKYQFNGEELKKLVSKNFS